jgi:hypothetical protein
MTAPRETGIAHDREQPGFSISASIAVKESEGPQIRFLNYVLRILLISG